MRLIFIFLHPECWGASQASTCQTNTVQLSYPTSPFNLAILFSCLHCLLYVRLFSSLELFVLCPILSSQNIRPGLLIFLPQSNVKISVLSSSPKANNSQ